MKRARRQRGGSGLRRRHLAPPPSAEAHLGPSESKPTSQCEAIIGLALLLDSGTALEAEGASRNECTNNLKQIGLAMHDRRAAYLDRVALDFAQHMASATATDAGIEDAWRTAAKTKADISIESLENESDEGPLLQAASESLVEGACSAN